MSAADQKWNLMQNCKLASTVVDRIVILSVELQVVPVIGLSGSLAEEDNHWCCVNWSETLHLQRSLQIKSGKLVRFFGVAGHVANQLLVLTGHVANQLLILTAYLRTTCFTVTLW